MTVSDKDRKLAIVRVAQEVHGAAYGPAALRKAGLAVDALISHGWGPVAKLRAAVSSTLTELERLQTEAVESAGQDKGEDECESPSECHAAAATFAYARAIRALKTATEVTD